MAEKNGHSYKKELTKGFLKENPVLRLVLGTCPTLATSTSVVNGVGMGIAATIVLICSNMAISALRKVIPEKARIPAYIVIIASFVTVVQMLVKAFVPALDSSLGVFLPLIVVNCIILGRAEAYASKNPVLLSAVDGLGMGIGFTAALFLMGAIREIIGAGTFLAGIDTMLGEYIDLGTFTGFDFNAGLSNMGFAPMTLLILPAGGFFVFGMLIALANKLAERNGLESAKLNGCKGCPHASFCKNFSENSEISSDKCEDFSSSEASPKSASDKKINAESTAKKPVKSTVAEEKTDVSLTTENKEKTASHPDKKAAETEISEEKTETTSSESTDIPTESGSKKKKKRNKKQKPVTPSYDSIEPLPEVIPDFIKNSIKNKEEGKQ